MKKQKIMLLLEITLLIMIAGTIVSYAAGSNPPSDGVRYNSTTVKAALDDLYEKVEMLVVAVGPREHQIHL